MLHVYIWEEINGRKPKGSVIHHKDMNKSNYNIENLLLCKNESEHKKIHAGWIRNNDGDWIAKQCTKCKRILSLDEFYQRKSYTPLAQCKQCHIKTTNYYARNNPKTKEVKKLWYKKNNL